jgi:ABC-type transporter Mla MlaB component
VGIFSLFGKKEDRQHGSSDKDARGKRDTSSSRTSSRPDAGKPSSRPAPARRDAQAARATALKIDAIESEMTSEFVNLATTIQPMNTVPGGPQGNNKPAPSANPRSDAKPGKPAASLTLPPLSPETGTTTELLMGSSAVSNIAELSSEAAVVIEEAAIMYANGQAALAEQMLQTAIAEDLLGNVTQKAWWMLFDLYQIGGKKDEFEQLSIEYLTKFEMSPPAWAGAEPQSVVAPAGATPAVPFTGKLDKDCVKQVERIRKLAEDNRTLRLEFARIKGVDAAGCELLLSVLKSVQKSGHELVLVGAAELLVQIRAILEVGRRDDSEPAWLLMLEILQLLNREKEFEEASIDYCVTFEVSPPAFVAPHGKVTTAQTETEPVAEDSFKMPALVEGKVDNLILAIAAFSDEHDPAVIDCMQLARVDFAAAGRLLSGLAPFCGNGKAAIEFHHVNHLVAELFNVIGLKDIARILPRKF